MIFSTSSVVLAPVGPHQSSRAPGSGLRASLIKAVSVKAVWWSMMMYSVSACVPLGELAARVSTRMARRTLPRGSSSGCTKRK